VVYDVVQQVFNGTLERGYNRTLAFDLFSPTSGTDDRPVENLGLSSTKDITERVLDGQKASDASQVNKGMRLGYMGHLTLIAEEICKFGNREGLEQVVLDCVNRESWIEYVEGTLAETRDKDNAVLGGVRPQDSIGQRQMGIGGGGFTSNTASTLANAGITPQDSMALSEGTVGQGFEVHSGFGNDDEDEEMEEERVRENAFSEDEQVGELSFEDVDMDYR
jgi:SIT4-associating protein SAP185/190